MKALLCFPRNLSQLRHSKICKKCKKIHFQTFKSIAFDFKAGKILLIKSFQFNHFWRLCLAFPENIFNFVRPFPNIQNIRFARSGSLKTIFWNTSYDKLWNQKVLKALFCFPRNQSQLRHSKIYKQKTTSFSNAQNIRFSRKVASKPFSKMLPSRISGFKKIPKLCLAYSENAFEFVTQKLSNRWNMTFSNTQNICFGLQDSLKKIFKMFHTTNFEFKSFKIFILLPQKMVSI